MKPKSKLARRSAMLIAGLRSKAACLVFMSIVIVSAGAPAQAGETCRFESWQEFAKRVSEASPDTKRLALQKEAEEVAGAAADIRPQSLLDAQYTLGGMPWRSSELEASYLWTVEDQVKRSARRLAARAAVDHVAALVEDQRAQEMLSIALARQLLKRLELRREVLLETQGTYSKIIEVYERIPSRGPEQETSLAVMRIAKGETELRIRSLDLEEAEQLSRLSLLSGCEGLELPLAMLPKLANPRLVDGGEATNSTGLLRLETEGRLAKSRLDSEEKALLRDYSIGPVVLAQADDGKESFAFGLKASVPIGDERRIVGSRALAAELRTKTAEIETLTQRHRLEREAWKSRHEQAERALQKAIGYGEIAKVHGRFEKLFQSDRISAALVIESHRQMLEHVMSYSELEARASEALWNIRYLDGQLSWRDL